MSDFLTKLGEMLSRLADEETLSGGGTFRSGEAGCSFGYSVRLGLPGVECRSRPRAKGSTAPDWEIQDEGGFLRVLVHMRRAMGPVSVNLQDGDLVVKSGETTLCRIPLPVPVHADTLRWSLRHGVLEVKIQKSTGEVGGVGGLTGGGGGSGGT